MQATTRKGPLLHSVLIVPTPSADRQRKPRQACGWRTHPAGPWSGGPGLSVPAPSLRLGFCATSQRPVRGKPLPRLPTLSVQPPVATPQPRVTLKSPILGKRPRAPETGQGGSGRRLRSRRHPVPGLKRNERACPLGAKERCGQGRGQGPAQGPPGAWSGVAR